MTISRICNDLQREVQAFKETVSDKPLTKHQLQPFITAMNDKTAALQQLSSTKHFTATKPELQAVTKLNEAVAALGNMPAIANQLGKGNVGNVLLALSATLEELRQKPKEKALPKKMGIRIEKYEVAQFLNSTEKELEHFITVIKMDDADEDVLFGIIIEILRRMELLKMVKHSLVHHKVTAEVDPIFYKRILKVLQEFTKERMQKRIYTIGEAGEHNMHTRLLSLLKAFQTLVTSCLKS